MASVPPRGGFTDPNSYPIASPWSSSDLQRIVFEDIFGEDIPTNTRAAAMRLPPVARGRNLLVSTICRMPLVQLGSREQLPDVDDAAGWAALEQRTPAWLYRCDDGTSPQQRLAWTVDDLIFYGWSCWWRRNGSDGFPLAAGRLNQERLGDRRRLPCRRRRHPRRRPEDVILIPGLHEGILSFGVDVLRDARSLYRIVRARINNPVPLTEPPPDRRRPAHRRRDRPLIDRLGRGPRRREAAASGYTNKAIEPRARRRRRRDAPDRGPQRRRRRPRPRSSASTAGHGRRHRPQGLAELRDHHRAATRSSSTSTVALYMTPITARLSLDDVVARAAAASPSTRRLHRAGTPPHRPEPAGLTVSLSIPAPAPGHRGRHRRRAVAEFGGATVTASTVTRTLAGPVARYGVYGRTSAGRLKVAPGALRFPADLTRVKLTREHERDQAARPPRRVHGRPTTAIRASAAGLRRPRRRRRPPRGRRPDPRRLQLRRRRRSVRRAT